MEYLIGFLLPPFIDYLNKNIQSATEKAWVTVITCILVACGIDWSLIINGTFSDVKSILILAGVIIGEAMMIYQVYWKGSQLRVILPGNGINAVPNSS